MGYRLTREGLNVANLITCFEPAANESSRVLILGSMPGERSIIAGQYYAYQGNAFWRIMNRVVGLDPEGPYEDRVNALKRAGIGLWDVMRSCKRRGSLDTAIELDSVSPNDFRALLDQHPRVELICFNGSAAERCYERDILPTLKKTSITYARLPSTSPAYASMSFEQKVAAWRSAISSHLIPR
jgi:hypoxanthine-DNA glycosylase